MSDIKISQSPAATSVSSSEIILMNNDGVTKSSPISYLPTGNVIGEYTLNFEDELKSAIATGRYEKSNYNAAKKEAAYMKFALSTACQKLHKILKNLLIITGFYWFW